jgi:hypothetical protein
MSNRLLTFECDGQRQVVEVHANQEGLDYLIEALSRLRDSAIPDHIHMMTPAWGGQELSETNQNVEFAHLQHVKVCKW